MPVIAIDFGGTNIKIGLVDNGKILLTQSIPAISSEGIRPRLEEVRSRINGLLNKQGLSPGDCSGIGIAIPGIVDVRQRRVCSINKKYEDAVTVDFPKWCDESFGLKLMMDNDANCAILGETRYGCAIGLTDAVIMIFGTGIGTAALIGEKLLRGRHYQAGCLGGHLIIDRNGPVCTCGNRGCIEAHAGTWALPAIAKGSNCFADSQLSKQTEIDYKSVIECMRQGDACSKALFGELLDCWGAGLVNLVHAYDPEVIILSGGLMKDSELILPHLKRYVRNNAWTPWGDVEFRVSGQPDASVLLGLYSLCTDATEQEG